MVASPTRAPRAGSVRRPSALLLPAYLVHLGEEWFAGFIPWTARLFGRPIEVDRFWWINGTAIVLVSAIALGALFSSRPLFPRASVAVAALFGLNGLLHAGATLAFASYSPGVVSGLAIYLPLAAVILRRALDELPRPIFSAAVVAGLLAHAAVTILAMSR